MAGDEAAPRKMFSCMGTWVHVSSLMELNWLDIGPIHSRRRPLDIESTAVYILGEFHTSFQASAFHTVLISIFYLLYE